MNRTSVRLGALAAMFGMVAANAQAGILSWSNSISASDYHYYNNWVAGTSGYTHSFSQSGSLGGVVDPDTWTYPLSSAMFTFSVSNAVLGTNTSTFLEIFGQQAGKGYAESNSTQSWYQAESEQHEQLSFTLDNPGTVSVTFFSLIFSGGSNTGANTYFSIDGNYYTASQAAALGAGAHTISVNSSDYGDAGNAYGYPLGSGNYGNPELSFDIQVYSQAVPEPASLGALVVSAACLLRRRSKR